MRQKRLNYEASVVVVFGGSFLGQIVSKSPLFDDETRRAILRDLFEGVFETHFFSALLYARARKAMNKKDASNPHNTIQGQSL
jgi:hypothetical protein